MSNEALAFWSIPAITGVVGLLINWSGVVMLFLPLQLHGIPVPGLRDLSRFLPRRVRDVPGLAEGRLGWQGLVPARAGKMASISVDKVIAKLGTPAEFYVQLEPDRIAEQIVVVFDPEVPGIVHDVMRRTKPALWRSLPAGAQRLVYERVRTELPGIVAHITGELGTHIDQVLDPKLMVVDHLQSQPQLINRIFLDIGRRELRLMVIFGFVFGLLLGIPVAFLDQAVHQWWVLPITGIAVGWMTNRLGMWLIFEPAHPRRVLGIRVQGLFLRRQEEVAAIYADIIADDVVTLERIGEFLLNGPRGDRMRTMLETALGPAIDRAAGRLRPAVRAIVGAREYGAIREQVAADAATHTLKPFLDKDFSRRQSENIRALFTSRIRAMPAEDFVEMLRSAIKTDEWMLYAHGAIMGAAGGLFHLLLFGTPH